MNAENVVEQSPARTIRVGGREVRVRFKSAPAAAETDARAGAPAFVAGQVVHTTHAPLSSEWQWREGVVLRAYTQSAVPEVLEWWVRWTDGRGDRFGDQAIIAEKFLQAGPIRSGEREGMQDLLGELRASVVKTARARREAADRARVEATGVFDSVDERIACTDAHQGARAKRGARDRRGRLVPTVKQPSVTTLEKMVTDQTPVKATDGCRVELDGTCPHGHVSWPWYVGF